MHLTSKAHIFIALNRTIHRFTDLFSELSSLLNVHELWMSLQILCKFMIAHDKSNIVQRD